MLDGLWMNATPERDFREDIVSSIMTRNVHRCQSSETVLSSLSRMVEKDVGSLVVDDGDHLGIVTERDVVRKLVLMGGSEGEAPFLRKTVREIMTPDAITITSQTLVLEAASKMVNNKVRRLPVVDDGKLVGLVTERDVFRWFVQATQRAMPESVKGALSGYEFLFI